MTTIMEILIFKKSFENVESGEGEGDVEMVESALEEVYPADPSSLSDIEASESELIPISEFGEDILEVSILLESFSVYSKITQWSTY